ncbi:MAG: GAF domain-containing protein [Anaerolineae bacterium]|nr:GAF domain-containing protein [Anaerolineae bacterium]
MVDKKYLLLHRRKLRLGPALALCLLLLASVWSTQPSGASAQTATDELPKNILVLNAYNQGLSWSDNIVRGITSVLNPAASEGAAPPSGAAAVELYLEYMDTKRLVPDAAYYERLYELYKQKYHGVKFDVIIVADNDAFNFMLEYHDRLFPDVPVVFCGVNLFEDVMLEGKRTQFTGVVESVDVRATLDVALAQRPQTREILVVNDGTTTGLVYSRLFREVAQDYEDRVNFVYYENTDVRALEVALRNLTEDNLVLLILFNRDRSQRFYTYEQAIDLIYANTKAPIYGLWDFYLGRGMVGGKLTNAFSQGEAAAFKAQRILEGSAAGDIPIQWESPNRYMFDYDQLQKFNIDTATLPVNSEIINRPLAFIEQYGAVIWPLSAVGLVLVGTVVAQSISAARRRRIEAALRVSNAELLETRASLEERVDARTRDLSKRTQQLQLAAEVARDVASIHDEDALLDSMVNLISDRFGYYHAGIFLANAAGTYAQLRAASSEGGQRMLARGHRLDAGVGIVGSVLVTGRPRIALDVGADAVWFNNPDLPNTRSELGLPLRARGQVIGVLDVQSTEPEAFSEEDVTVLQTMAEQLALALDNVRLLEESEAALSRMERAFGQETRTAWAERKRRGLSAYRFEGQTVSPIPVSAVSAPNTVLPNAVAANITLRDQVLATLELERSPERPWTQEELELVQTLTEQAALALDNARLFEDTLRRSERERLVGQIVDNIRASASVEQALQRALSDMSRVLGAAELVAQLGPLVQAPFPAPPSVGEEV